MIVAVQNIGSGIGNMLSILNIVAICSVVGLHGEEGEIIQKALLPTITLGVLISILGMILVYTAGHGIY